ncbi:MAG: gliding motility-associated C-terminal domain-containing protein [Bacteroidales bacterium]|jgi:gliding motility-associated-like protein|nr:gliding motility-associated C-terminal domain-containing protein [Bacteroidales bacterium]
MFVSGLLKAEHDSLSAPNFAPPPPVSFEFENYVVCADEEVKLKPKVSSTLTPTRYVWTTSMTIVGANNVEEITVTATTQQSFDVSISVYDASDALIGNATTTVIVTRRPQEPLIPINDTVCSNRESSLSIRTNEPCSFLWKNNGISSDPSWIAGEDEDKIAVYPPVYEYQTEEGEYYYLAQVSLQPLNNIQYSNTCFSEVTAKVKVGDAPRFSFTANDTMICQRDTVQLIVGDASDIVWKNPDTANSQTEIGYVIDEIRDFTFEVEANDSRGCRGVKTLTVHGQPKPEAVDILLDGALSTDDTICRGATVTLSVESPDGLSYSWDYLSMTTPEIEVVPRNIQTYTVTVFGEPNQQGCFVTASKTLEVKNCDIVYFPSAISLSSQISQNRIFKPIGIPNSFNEYHLAIFNRWGQLLFESNDFNLGWNGTHQGENVRPGVYVYYFRLSNRQDSWEKRGTVTVVD